MFFYSRRWNYGFLTTFCAMGICFCSAGKRIEAEDVPTANADHQPADDFYFEKHVRPILKAHCFQCHGEEPDVAGGLDLRLVRLMNIGGDSGSAIVAGNPDQSYLWQKVSSEEMPPGPKKLSSNERATIQQWIQQGARTARQEPDDPSQARFTEEELSHWAFQPVVAPIIPDLTETPPGLSAIDHFIVQRQREHGLSLAPQADRATLLRRLSFNLIGLPPTLDEHLDFQQDTREDAYERVVERLLASPQYGVRWARHWLDVAGYAESDGQIVNDRLRPHAWRYRDYVVDALNRDIPYSQFVIEQLAGDQLIEGSLDPNNDEHARLLAATGLLQMAPDLTESEDTLLNRNQAVADTLATVTSAFVGLTVACAQCHDHRYDPITIEDYYSLRAVFDPTFPIHQWRKPSQRLVDMTNDAIKAERARIEAEAVRLQEDISARRRAHCQTIQDREINAAPEEVRESLRMAVDIPPDQQTAEQKALLESYPKVRTLDWIVGQLVEYDNKAHRDFQEEEQQVAGIRQTKPIDRTIMAVSETQNSTPSHVFYRGEPYSPTSEVHPRELTVLTRGRSHQAIAHSVRPSARLVSAPGGLNPSIADAHVPEGESSRTKRRLEYACQLTDGTHPLVARVIVNRVWQHHFGQGLVRTPGDFGLNGQKPTHPELLDWLADDFVQHDWSLKHLHRRIVQSVVFQQMSALPAGSEPLEGMRLAQELDPDNRWLSRMSLRRLDAESLRDAILAVSGQLSDQLSGPSVPIAEDEEGKAVIGDRILRDGLFAGIQDVGQQACRRSLYLCGHRSLQLNTLQTFDLPTMNPNCQKRNSSTVAPQALLMLNDPWIIDAAEKMAERIRTFDELGEGSVLATAFWMTFGQPPTDHQLALSQQFLDDQTELFRVLADEEWQNRLREDPTALQDRALASLCQMLMASNRFIYLH